MILKLLRYIITTVKLTCYKVDFGKKVLGNSFYIINKGSIKLGNKINLKSFPEGSCFRTVLATYFKESRIEIGNKCALNGVALYCNEFIKIGNNCMFGPGTIICDNNSHRVVLDYQDRNKKAVSSPIIIKDNVWIGMNCTVMKGVTIGENSIIAAGTMVLRDVPENSLYGGNPARLIKKLT
jgi:acetyltransferase-like isoleucine patch superfamily enzyme